MTAPDAAAVPGGTADEELVRGGTRRACAALLCVALLAAGVALALSTGEPARDTDLAMPVMVALFTVLYAAAHHFSVDFELRRDSHSVTLVQLPLAVGVLHLLPGAHLASRLAAVALLAVRQRQDPLKALYNLSAAAIEVGTAAWAVSRLGDDPDGPALWLALYLGLLAGDVLGSLVLSAVWRLVGRPVTLRSALRSVVVVAPATLVFTALAIVALAAAEEHPEIWAVMLGLAFALGLAYRAHLKVVGQQAATSRLYELVKDLGPLDLDSPAAEQALERMRLLVHAQRLDLALRRSGSWWRVVAQEGQAPTRSRSAAADGRDPGTGLQGSVLGSRHGGDEDTMATPLLAGTELAGLLSATGRLGAARGFDMGDLRLLETVGAELATALDRGRLLTDLEQSATTDALTGLPNLPETTRRVDALLAEHPDVVVAAVTVHSFREVNDTLGRDVGDRLLLEVARRLGRACPAGVVGRVGGSRFAVALPSHLVGGDPELFGLALRAQVEGAAQIGPVGTHVRLSVGMTTAPAHGAEAATLVRRAETVMYSARHAGGGPVLWEPAYEVQGTRRLAVVMALREALASGAIAVAYQPKVATATDRVVGVEALARWTHPALGAIGPDEFVPLAEASGLMAPLTATVLTQSLGACRAWQGRSPGVGVSVNVSADTLLDAAFVTEVSSLLDTVGVPARHLTLELTESVLLEDAVLAAERMGELRALGVRLSVDDFGTGYSSLTYLRGLPVDEVKIDKGFVDGLSRDPADRAVVRAVVDIAHTLGLQVVAEGVELEDQHALLRALGVDQVQGYLHGRPMPAHEISTWLQRRAARTTR